ncbi:tandem-95 repeat protein [Cryomorphaceae bacterium]|nr:tandem-95 repeat protein [Cryomorphaceae bacterium]
MTLTVTDENGNTDQCTATVTVEDNIDPTAICQDITIQLDASGNASISTSDIDNGSADNCAITSVSLSQTSFNCAHVGVNSVTLTVTDSNGNTDQCIATVTVQDITPPTALCQDFTVTLDANGQATIAVSDIDNGSNDACGISSTVLSTTTFDCSDVGTNTVTLTVTDNNGNSSSCTATVTVIEPTITAASITVNDNVSCFGGNDGSATVSVSGNVGGYSYLWDSGETTATAIALNAGAHNVTVTTGACSSDTILSVTITQPTQITAGTDNITDVSCFGQNDGAIDITVSGGTAPYSFLWSNGDNTQNISGLDIGNYTVTITDDNGCTSTASGFVHGPTQALSAGVDNLSNISCVGGSDGAIDISVSGGTAPYTYTWSNGESTQDISALTVGTYSLTVTDDNGCTAVISNILVDEPANGLTAGINNLLNVDCFGDSNGAIDISVSGGTAPYTYSWSTGASTQDISGLVVGLYSVTVTDANGCTTNIPTITVDGPAQALTASILSFTDANCPGGSDGSATATASGGTAPYAYLWSASAGNQITSTATGLAAGVYEVTVTDVNGCDATTSVTISGTDLTPPTALCNSFSLPLDATGNATISVVDIDGGSSDNCGISAMSIDLTDFDCSDIGPQVVTLTVIDVSGLSSQCTTTITVVDTITPVIATCPADTTFEVDASCDAFAPDYLTSLSVTDNCSITSAVQNPAVGSPLPIGTTTVTITVTDAGGNIATCSVDVTVTDPGINASTSQLSPVTCFGDSDGSALVSVSGGSGSYMYLWDNGETTATATALSGGTHFVTVTGVGCGGSATLNVVIAEPTQLNVSVGSQTNVSCNGIADGEATLSLVGGTTPYSYIWPASAANQTTVTGSNLAAGSYGVTVIDANGCTATTTVTITEPAPLVVVGSGTDVDCFGANTGSVSLTVSGGTGVYSFDWSNGSTTQNITSLAAGTYDVTVTDANGCENVQSYSLSQPATAVSVVGTVVNTTTLNNGSIDITPSGGTGSYTYAWSNGANTQDISGLTSGPYSVTVTDANGCTAVAIFNVLDDNLPPVAVDDTASTPIGTPVTLGCTVNDSDPDGNLDTLSVAIIIPPLNGTAVVNPLTGEITYTPNPGFTGVDTLTYQVCDSLGLCSTAYNIITVVGSNVPPIAVTDSVTTDEDVTVVIDPLTNDSDPDASIDPTTVSIITGPQNGTTTVDPITGEITYTPNPDYYGPDSLIYQVCDTGTPLPALCDTAWIYVNVIPQPDTIYPGTVGPMGNLSVFEDSVLNHCNPVTTSLLYVADSLGSFMVANNGTITGIGDGDGCATYTPDPNYNGIDTVTTIICDASGDCQVVYSTITVIPVNDPPVAVNDTVGTMEATPVTIDIANNDYAPIDGNIDPTSVVVTVSPSNGSVTVDPITGALTYTPNAGFTGTDSIQYAICDDGFPLPAECDTAWVFIDVDAVNDPPIAINDFDTTSSGTPVSIDVTANDSDTDGNIDPTTVTIIGGPNNGTATVDPVTGVITYTPDSTFVGSDTITYVVCDDGTPLPSECDTAQVIVEVEEREFAFGFVVPECDNDVAKLSWDINLLNFPSPGPTPLTITWADSLGNVIHVDSNLALTGTVLWPGMVVDNNGNPLDWPGWILQNGIWVPGADGFEGLRPEAVVTFSINPSATVTLTYPPATPACGAEPPSNPIAVNDTVSTPQDVGISIAVLNNDLPSDTTLNPGTVAVLTGPHNGTVVVNPNGTVSYQPTAGYAGPDSLSYVVCDNNAQPLCDTAWVYIDVISVLQPPVAVDDVTGTQEDQPVLISLLVNDFDTDGTIDTSSVTILSGPSNGTVSYDPVTGQLLYSPNPGFSGVDSVQYQVCDNDGLCDTAWITITVSPENDPPVAVNDTTNTLEETGVVIDVTNNDFDTDASIDPTTVNVITPPQNGSYNVDPVTGQVTYVPNIDFVGTDSLTYIVCDTGTPLPSLCDTAVVYIDVLPVNDPPIAVDDVVGTLEDTPVTIAAPGNDSDIDGNIDPTTLTIISGPSNGTATVDPVTGEVTYTPDTNFVGVDTLTYVICDDGTPLPSLCDTAQIFVQVGSINDAPVALVDSSSTLEDTPVVIDVVLNDFDTDATIDPTTVTIVQPATNGSVNIDPVTGEVTYTPLPGFFGTDSLIYQVCDTGTPLPALCDTAWVYIEVLPVNDPPIAVYDSTGTPEDTPVTVDVVSNDSDTDGNIDPTTVTIVGGPTNGTATVDPVTGEITYTPNPGYTGVDSVLYSVCDDGTPLPAECDTAWLAIGVIPTLIPPVAINDTVNTPVNTPVLIDVLVNDSDADGFLVPSTVTVSTPPANGSISIDPVTGAITYTPNAGFTGTDVFTYTVCDNDGLCASAEVIVEIEDTNEPPVAVNDTLTGLSGSGVTTDPTANDYDLDGNIDPTTVVIISGPQNGTTGPINGNGMFDYIPNPGFTGVDSLVYAVCDDGTPLPSECDTAVVYYYINQNNPPVANCTGTVDAQGNCVFQTYEDSTITICFDITDPDGHNVSVGAALNGPSNGTVGSAIGNDSCFVYTPDPNWYGWDTVTVEICDDFTPAACTSITVAIEVLPINDPPIAINDTASVDQDMTVIVDVLNNDNDSIDGLPLDTSSVMILNGPFNGLATVNPDGTITYDPNNSFTGTDSLIYVVCDNGFPLPSICDTAVVYFDVVDVNNPPVAVVDTIPVTTPEDIPIQVCVPFFDPDADPISWGSILTLPQNGGLSGLSANDSCFTYTPDPNYVGNDTVVLVACDPGGLCDTVTVIIDVTPVNDGVVANGDSGTLWEDSTAIIDPLNNDFDPDGPQNIDSTSFAITTMPVNGTVIINPDGTITYTPDPDYYGLDSLMYVICDNFGACDSAWVMLNVLPRNDAPIAQNDTLCTVEDQATVSYNILANDTDSIDLAFLDPANGFTVLSGPSNGTYSLDVNNNIIYNPNTDFTGIDSIQYAVCDTGYGLPPFDLTLCDTAWIYITVVPVNDPITFNNGATIDTAASDTSMTYTIADFVSDSTDTQYGTGGLDLDSVTIQQNVSNGFVVYDSLTGVFTYTPDPCFNGIDTLIYTVCDVIIPGDPNLPCNNNVGATCATVTAYFDASAVGAPDTSIIANQDSILTPGTQSAVIDIFDNDDLAGDSLYVAGIVDTAQFLYGTYTLVDSVLTYIPDSTLGCYTDSAMYFVTGADNSCIGDTAWIYVTVQPYDSDNDGLPDFYEGFTLDTDNDGVPNYLDPDSDNDGIGDYLEAGPPIDPCDPQPFDNDGDGVPDHLDLDSDNDGIADFLERSNGSLVGPPSGVDSDGDGIDDAYDPDQGGTLINDFAWDEDGDGIPDYLDIDSDGDGIPDWVENILSVVPPTGIDSDGDGIDDAYDPDHTNIPSSEWTFGQEPNDQDQDGIPDFRDLDSDNDSLPDEDEKGDNGDNPRNTDNDKLADFRDVDSDDDGVPDEIDSPTGDCDGDGLPDLLDPDLCVLTQLPDGISPNGDGINEFFEIKGIEDYPLNTLKIYNRWGNLVYQAAPYLNQFDGRANVTVPTGQGQLLPEGTYFYVLDLGIEGVDPVSGYIYIRY